MFRAACKRAAELADREVHRDGGGSWNLGSLNLSNGAKVEDWGKSRFSERPTYRLHSEGMKPGAKGDVAKEGMSLQEGMLNKLDVELNSAMKDVLKSDLKDLTWASPENKEQLLQRLDKVKASMGTPAEDVIGRLKGFITNLPVSQQDARDTSFRAHVLGGSELKSHPVAFEGDESDDSDKPSGPVQQNSDPPASQPDIQAVWANGSKKVAKAILGQIKKIPLGGRTSHRGSLDEPSGVQVSFSREASVAKQTLVSAFSGAASSTGACAASTSSEASDAEDGFQPDEGLHSTEDAWKIQALREQSHRLPFPDAEGHQPSSVTMKS